MQVAVAQVAEVDQRHAGKGRRQCRVGGRDEGRDAGYGQRDVVLHVRPLGRLGERDRFAQVPHRARLLQRAGHRRVGDQAAVERGFEQALEQAAPIRAADERINEIFRMRHEAQHV